ncbi:Osi13 [Drosophila busckii]|uniref:Osi13 n=1 Tax=Drosophila busckii TaxID=30019 RepID=A0A0M3QY03_DROBS|nr:uncharacterized protein LOC108603897 [Drosophila busckii]ALC46823.1 Osi13 [Drosophila busckii]
MLFVFAILLVSCALAQSLPQGLPPAVQLGGAIVAAVEQDVEQDEAELERRQRAWLTHAERQVYKFLNDELSSEQVLSLLDNWSSQARGKHHKQKKLLKMLYPLLGAAVLAKVILLPLILKWLTALSASSFVMGKIALAASGLLALKSIMSAGHARDRLEIIHSSAPSLKAYHGDLSSSGSSWLPIRPHYIPLGVSNKDVYKPFL